MLTYHSLKVAEVKPESGDAVCVSFAVPEDLRPAYRFSPGQHVGLRVRLGGQEVRRTYSICSGCNDRYLRIGVRVHDHGCLSRYLASDLRAGDSLDVLTPTGRFFVEANPTAAKTYCAFAGGSGITPILGILRNLLEQEPLGRFILFYSNRTTASIMFADELLALKDRYPTRLSLYFILSREPQELELFNGRLDRDKVSELSRWVFDPAATDAFLLCGPGTMIESVHDTLLELGVEPSRIHAERFASDTPANAPSVVAPAEVSNSRASPEALAQITVVMDGRRRTFEMLDDDATVLEAAERVGLELPYSCRAGVCSTCRAKVTRGEARMATNYALEPWETQAGFVLCCQARPIGDELELSYDER